MGMASNGRNSAHLGPLRLASRRPVLDPGGDEEQRREPIQIANYRRVDLITGMDQCHHLSLAAASHGPGHVERRSRSRFSWQDELSWQIDTGRHGISLGFQPVDAIL